MREVIRNVCRLVSDSLADAAVHGWLRDLASVRQGSALYRPDSILSTTSVMISGSAAAIVLPTALGGGVSAAPGTDEAGLSMPLREGGQGSSPLAFPPRPQGYDNRVLHRKRDRQAYPCQHRFQPADVRDVSRVVFARHGNVRKQAEVFKVVRASGSHGQQAQRQEHPRPPPCRQPANVITKAPR